MAPRQKRGGKKNEFTTNSCIMHAKYNRRSTDDDSSIHNCPPMPLHTNTLRPFHFPVVKSTGIGFGCKHEEKKDSLLGLSQPYRDSISKSLKSSVPFAGLKEKHTRWPKKQ